MDATPHLPGPPPRRVPAAVRTGIAWGTAAAFPVALIGTLLVVPRGDPRGLSVLESIPPYLLPAVVMALPAGLLRRGPLTALALMVVGAAAMTAGIHSSWHPGYLADLRYLQLLAIDLMVGYLAATRPRRVSAPVAVLTLCAQIAIGYVNPGEDPIFAPEIPTLAMVAAWMIGNSVRARRRYAAAIQAQATVQAVTAERLRIARELHDMIAHNIGIIAIQAGMGSRVMDTQPAETRSALRAIEATSRETLAGLRRVLGGLRQTVPPGDPGPTSPGPAPGLADLDRLADSSVQVGVRVELRRRGEQRPVPADIELSAYRIVQEAVTNVVRHADTPRCRVTVEYRVGELRIEVIDDGRGGPVRAAGYGITGMRERVNLLHGEFSAGPRPEGGFRVSASLPLPVASSVAGTAGRMTDGDASARAESV